ncbi:MAG TPA: hypothetical protein VH008_22555 [Pseudonocardia sp.]|jgi:hypothetical protein|nr:hypothetical protein [Pseudonocardia sp.]
MRAGWKAWVWPTIIFAAIPAGLLVMVLLKPYLSDPTANAAPTPLDAAVHVNTHTWRSIAQDPAGHAQDRLVLWGQVTEFDRATSTFYANVDAARHTPSNGTVNYPTAVIMHGDPATLQNLARGYIFKAEATLDGAVPQSTASGGKAPIPTLTVTKLTITDKTVG